MTQLPCGNTIVRVLPFVAGVFLIILFGGDDPFSALAVDRTETVYAVILGGVLISTDRGETWTEYRKGQIFPSGSPRVSIYSFAFKPDEGIVARTKNGIHVSRDGGRSWRLTENVLTGTRVSSLAIDREGRLFTAGSGETWITPESSLPSTQSWVEFSSFAVIFDGGVLAGWSGRSGALFRSDDDGDSWFPVDSDVPAPVVTDFAIYPDGLALAATRFDGVLRSADRGASWTLVSSELREIRFLAVGIQGKVFAVLNHSVY